MMQEYGIKDSWTKIMSHQTHDKIFMCNLLDFEVYLPEHDQGSGKSKHQWTVEKVCKQFNEIPSTQKYIKFETRTYSESLVSVSPGVCTDHEFSSMERMVSRVAYQTYS